MKKIIAVSVIALSLVSGMAVAGGRSGDGNPKNQLGYGEKTTQKPLFVYKDGKFEKNPERVNSDK